MDQALQTMIENLQRNSGKSLQEWVQIVRNRGFDKHSEIIRFLKEEHAFTHGFANLVAHKARESDAGSATDSDDSIEAQYQGKEHLKPIYLKLIEFVNDLGTDIEIAPKKAYVSLRRKKQFAILLPATKSRFELQLNLKGVEENEILQHISKANAMCTHQINLNAVEDITGEIYEYLKKAYEGAG